MLTLILQDGTSVPLPYDKYYIKYLWSGLDEVIFSCGIWDEYYPQMREESQLIEQHEEDNAIKKTKYLIKAIDGGKKTATIKAQIDIDDLKSTMYVPYTNDSATCAATLKSVLPDGWIVIDAAGFTFKRTVELESATAVDVIEACRDIYSVTFRFDNDAKTVTIIDPDAYSPVGAFVSRDLNMKELTYTGKSTDFATRLYAYGADGLTFSSINDGKPYVEDHTYSDRIICAYWKDDRYINATSLLEAAKKRLSTLSYPKRSYNCSVNDLAKVAPDIYGFANFALFQVVTLIDDTRSKIGINHQVVEYWQYPFYPDLNKVVLSTVAPRVQTQVRQLEQQISSPNSTFRQQISAAQNAATSQITGVLGGYVRINSDANGKPYEILIMDTDDISTAVDVWRWNLAGLGHSQSGYNGPYTTAITQDGSIVADFITSGSLTANIINSGLLQSANGSTYFNLDTSEIKCVGKKVYLAADYQQTDLDRVVDIITNGETPTAEELEKYNISGTGLINNTDRILIRNMINGTSGDVTVTWTATISPLSNTSIINVQRHILSATGSTDTTTDIFNIAAGSISIAAVNGYTPHLAVDEGTSGIWTYIKYDDGFAECWGTYSGTVSLSNTMNGVNYCNTVRVNYPFTFASAPVYTLSGGSDSSVNWARKFGSALTDRATFIVVGMTAQTNVTVYVNIHAIGKWK